MQENRADISKSNPSAGIADIAKIAGGIWREMASGDKVEWEGKAKEDKERLEIFVIH